MRKKGPPCVVGLLVVLMMTACATNRFPHRRMIIRQAATELANGYGQVAANTKEARLKAAYLSAQARCKMVQDLLTKPADTTRFLDDPGRLSELQCQLDTVRLEMAEWRRLTGRVAELDDLVRWQAVQLKGNASKQAEYQARLQWLARLSTAKTRKTLAQAIDEVEKGLREVGAKQQPAQLAARQGRMNAVVDIKIESVDDKLEKARKETPNGPKVGYLESAKSSLQAAKAMLAKDGANQFALDEAQGLIDAADGQDDRADHEIIVRPSPFFRAHAGAISLSPYVVGRPRTDPTGRFELQEVSGDPTAYLELDFHGRDAWLTPRQRMQVDEDYGLGTLAAIVPDDYEGRIRFLNNSEIDSRESAVAGDIAVETLIGWSLFGIGLLDEQACLQNPRLRTKAQGTINFEFGSGFVTDTSTTDGHGYFHAGLGTAWSFPVPIDTDVYRMATVYFGLYYGVSDYPQLDVDDVQYHLRDRPVFNALGSLSARVDAAIPLTRSLDAVIGARYADPLSRGDLPESWSVFVGVSIPIGKIFEAVTD